MHHDFELAGRRARLWQRPGEGYGHVLMKALGYCMFVEAYPSLEIEKRVRLRYKPDLVAERDASEAGNRFSFWGECGLVTVRKVAWLLKHGGVDRVVLFKTGTNVAALTAELRAGVEARYRPQGRLCLVNFAADVAERASSRKLESVPRSWYKSTEV